MGGMPLETHRAPSAILAAPPLHPVATIVVPLTMAQKGRASEV